LVSRISTCLHLRSGTAGGANLVRLAMYTDEYGGYCSGGDKAQLEAVVDKGVKAATDLGMYVIIDWQCAA
jgi:aryl-phospho-beta-D-glucosidase BglC (GH1 family)